MRKLLPMALLLCLVVQTASAQDSAYAKKEAAFTKACKSVVELLHKKDVKKLDAFIHVKNGVYILYRPGALDAWEKDMHLDKEDQRIFETNALPKPNHAKLPLQFGKSPSFNCEKDRWSKVGFFADSLKKYNAVSSIIEFRNKYGEDSVSKKDIANIKYMESKCRKVTYAYSRSGGIIFYMAWINNKWYLAIIDLVTTDCSA